MAPRVEVVGGTLAHSGTNKRGTGRDTHSPARFILDMGTAYRASHRTKPIMDAFSYHPYMERSDLPPTYRHNPLANTVTIADYGKLISLLQRAFGGTKQKGQTLPLVYDEFGVEAKIPPAPRVALHRDASRRPRIPSARRRRPGTTPTASTSPRASRRCER